MEANNNNNQAQNESDDDEPILNLYTRVPPTPKNSRGYLPFDMRLVPNYMNSQIAYYYTNGAIPAADQARFHQLMKQRKTSLDLIRWDGESDGGNEGNGERSNSALTSGSNETSSNSDCPAPLPNFKGIKIAPGDITKL